MMICIKCKKEIPDDARFCQWCGKDQTKKAAGRSRANGMGTVYKRGKTWVAEISLGRKVIDGRTQYVRRKKGGFKTKTEALAFIPQLQDLPARKCPTVQELWERYSAGPMLKTASNTQSKYRTAFKRWQPLAFQQIDILTTADLQSVVDEKTASYYPAKDMRDLMSNLYQLALPDQFVSSNLAQYIDLPKLEETEPEPFTDAEVTALWSDYGNGNTFTGYILLMIYTGMMPCELLDCRKDMVDFERQQIVRVGRKTPTRKKTPLVLASFMLPVVQDLIEYSKGPKLLTMNKDRFYDEYYAVLQRAGCRRLTPYSCRHTTATALALDNIAPSIVQKVMRHAKFATTQRYIHVDTSEQLAALNSLPVPAKHQA